MQDPRAWLVEAYRQAARSDPRFAPHADVVFQREGTLGEGGMGVVHRVRDLRLGRPAALKVLKGVSDLERVARFLREAELTARLDHPSIPPVYEAGTDAGGRVFMLMRLVEGESLAERIRAAHRTPDALAPAQRGLLEALVKVTDAVAYAHSQRVIHRDLKPQNIMLGRFGEVLVMDWGLAADLDRPDPTKPEAAPTPGQDDALTQEGTVLGTLAYMPPEQANGERVDERADVFALGAILVELLTGAPPLGGDGPMSRLLAAAHGSVVLPRQRRRDVAPELHDIAAAALVADKERRTPSAEAFGRDLRAFLAGDEVSVHRYGVGERLARAARRRPGALVAASSVALFGSLAGAALLLAPARARLALAEDARTGAEAAWADVAAVASDEPGRRVGRALAALQAAQRWRDLQPGAPEAQAALRRAAEALGTVALETGQWDLAAQAFEQGRAGPDDPEVAARLAAVQTARSAEALRRRREVEEVLARARGGALTTAEAQSDAVFAIARYPDEQTEELVAAALDEVSLPLEQALDALLLSVAEPIPEEVRAGAGPIEGLHEALLALRDPLRPPTGAAAAALEAAQARVVRRASVEAGGARLAFADLAAGRLGGVAGRPLAAVCCEVLGRLGRRGRAVAALGRYLAAEHDRLRQVAAAVALCRLGGEEATARVAAARRAAGDESLLWRRTEPLLGASGGAAASGAEEPLAAGRRLMARGDLAGAAAAISPLLEREPGRAEAWALRGHVRLELGDRQGALADLSRALLLDESLGGAWADRGELRRLLRDDRAGRADFDRAIALLPGRAAPRIGRARCLLGADDRGALADAEAALALDGAQPDAWAVRGLARANLGELAAGLTDAERALTLDPERSLAHFVRGVIRHRLKELPGALSDLSRAVELEPEAASHLVARGDVRRDLGDGAGAEADYDAALVRGPDYVPGLLRRGVLRRGRGDLAGALADLDRAIALDPQAAGLLRERAEARRLAGDAPGARADLDEVLRRTPRDADAWNQRAIVRGQGGDPRGALADLEEALRLNPDHAAATNNRVGALLGLGDFEAAVAAAGRAIELDPQGANPRRNRALALRQLGRTREALEDLEVAARLAPQDGAVLAARGAAREQLGDADGALADYEAALRLDPRQPDAWLMRGQLRGRRGDREGAVADLRRFLELAPGHPLAPGVRQRLAKLEGR